LYGIPEKPAAQTAPLVLPYTQANASQNQKSRFFDNELTKSRIDRQNLNYENS
jgi:hypothetical protein